MSLRSLLLAAAPLIMSASPPAASTCQRLPPAPIGPTVAPNSTYSSESEPPRRFGHAPKVALHIAFGQAAIDATCGPPPCNKVFLGCERGDVIVLPDPFTTSDQEFARIVRHELGHVNGWPDTHGD